MEYRAVKNSAAEKKHTGFSHRYEPDTPAKKAAATKAANAAAAATEVNPDKAVKMPTGLLMPAKAVARIVEVPTTDATGCRHGQIGEREHAQLLYRFFFQRASAAFFALADGSSGEPRDATPCIRE